MPSESDGENWKRRDKERKLFTLKDLPFRLDSSILDDLGDVSKEQGIGKVLARIQEAVDGNFEHMGTEMRRFAMLYNESEADVHYLKGKFDPHDHDDGIAKNPMRGDDDDAGGNVYIRTYHFGESSDGTYVLDDAIQFVPFWIGENSFVDAFYARIIDMDVSVDQEIVVGIYNGDGPGGLPGSLLLEADPVALTSSGEVVVPLGSGLNLLRGHWYWAGTTTSGAGSGSAFWSIYQTSSEGSGVSGWWPFPALDTFGAGGSAIISYVWQDGAWSSGDPLPENLTHRSDELFPVGDALAAGLRVP